jgi:hypothetical protein
MRPFTFKGGKVPLGKPLLDALDRIGYGGLSAWKRRCSEAQHMDLCGAVRTPQR